MIAIIFEVEPDPERKDAYLDVAATLRDDLAQIEGFISVERFQSITNPEKLLSLSFFEDEEAVMRWRKLPAHRRAQAMGRQRVCAAQCCIGQGFGGGEAGWHSSLCAGKSVLADWV